MLDHSGFSAWIEVEGIKTLEYNVEVPKPNTITCWIASEVGKSFAVHWKDNLLLRMTGGYVELDGIPSGCMLVRPNGLDHTFLCGINTSITTMRPFVFSHVELTDDDCYLDSPSSQTIGNIVLRIWRVTDTGRSSVTSPTVAVPLVDKVHERSKKGQGHRITFGETKQRDPRKKSVVKKCDKEPLVTFLFKYRPIDLLRANGIAPSPSSTKRKATASPEPDVKFNASAMAEDEKFDAEAFKLLEEQVKTDQENVKAYQEKLEADKQKLEAARAKLGKKGSTAKRVKMENRPVFIPGEVIDLT